MARDFAGGTGTDRIVYTLTPTTQRSVFIRGYADSYDAAAAAPRWYEHLDRDILFYVHSAALGRFGAGWSTTSGAWTFTAPATGSWHTMGASYDGGATTNDPIVYVNGSSVSVTEVATPAGSLNTGSASLSIGNSPSLARGWNGRLCEHARWSVILTADEFAALHRGVNPLMVRPDSLVFYDPLFGRASPERDVVGGLSGTVTGAVVGDHPPGVTYPHRRGLIVPPAVAATYTRYRRPEGLATDMNGGTDRLLVWDNSLAVPRLKRAEILAADSGAPTLPNMPTGYATTGASWVKIEGSDGIVGAVPIWPPS